MEKYSAQQLAQLANKFNYVKLVNGDGTRAVRLWKEQTSIDYQEAIEGFINSLPSGSGFDNLPSIAEASQRELVLNVPFHIMNDGYYLGWVNYRVRIYPQFDGLNIGVTLSDVFENVADSDLSELKELGEASIEYISDVYWEMFGE